MSSYLDVIVFSLLGGVVSLAGGLLLAGSKRLAAKLIKYSTAFAAGALLGVALLDLLPETLEHLSSIAVGRWILVGIILFFILEHSLHWFHHHKHEHDHSKSAAPLIIVSDTVHNFIDGLAIGAAFLVNPATGITTAVAVAAHEIPQEIADFAILLKAGYARKKVIIINLLSSLATVAGALLTFGIGASIGLPVSELVAVTAGMFIYIAASDLIPDVHEQAKGRISKISALLLIAGVLVVGALTEIAHERTSHHSDCVDYRDKNGNSVFYKDCVFTEKQFDEHENSETYTTDPETGCPVHDSETDPLGCEYHSE